MAGKAVLEFTDDNFQTEVLDSDQPVLVDFWAEWCGPCRFLAPIIDELAEEYHGRAKIGKVNIDSDRKIATDLNIQSIPTVVFYKGGEVKQIKVGASRKKELAEELDKLVAD